MTHDSDLHLLVLKRGFENQQQGSARLHEALGGLGIPVDVFAMPPERFEESSGGGEPRPYEKNISRYAQLFTTLCIIKAECARERARKAESDYETGGHLY